MAQGGIGPSQAWTERSFKTASNVTPTAKAAATPGKSQPAQRLKA